MRILSISRAAITAALSFIAGSPRVAAQGSAPANIANDLDSLIARALVVSPTARAASLRVSAARARVGPAGARPDPLLMAALQNQPLSGARDPMTMHMIGISQTIPYPGKLPLRTRAAQREVDATMAVVDATRLDIARQVRAAYYEIAYADRALLILEQNRDVLADVIRVTEVHYSVGTGSQQDVLRARVEATRLGDDASALREQRRAQVAALNALLD